MEILTPAFAVVRDRLRRSAPPRRTLSRLTATVGLIIAVALVAGVPSASAASAAPSKRVTFGVEPAAPTGADGRPDFYFSVTPGATLLDHVAAVNYSLKPLSLQLYATDATETSAGGFGLLLPTTRPSGVGAWIQLPAGSGTVSVPAETAHGPGQLVIPFSIHVPAKATAGDHAGGIAVSLRSVGTDSRGQNIVLNQRVGTRVYIRVAGVGGALVPKLAVKEVRAYYHGSLNPGAAGRMNVSYVVSNVGNVDLGVQQSVTVSGWIGPDRRSHPANISVLLPGASLRENAVIANVWPQFVVNAKVAVGSLTVAGVPAAQTVAAGATESSLAIPWTALAIIVVLLVLLGYLVLRRRSRRARRAVRAPRDRRVKAQA